MILIFIQPRCQRLIHFFLGFHLIQRVISVILFVFECVDARAAVPECLRAIAVCVIGVVNRIDRILIVVFNIHCAEAVEIVIAEIIRNQVGIEGVGKRVIAVVSVGKRLVAEAVDDRRQPPARVVGVGLRVSRRQAQRGAPPRRVVCVFDVVTVGIRLARQTVQRVVLIGERFIADV